MQTCTGNDFLFYAANSKEDSIKGEIDDENYLVEILMPAGTDLTFIRPAFVNSPNSSIAVNGELQISGESIQDFSQGPVIYEITSEQGITQQWTVNITLTQNIRSLERFLSYYPNPSSGAVYIETNTLHLLPLSFTLRNITGQEVLNGSISKSPGYIDLKTLENGLYYLTVFNKDLHDTRKIILNR